MTTASDESENSPSIHDGEGDPLTPTSPLFLLGKRLLFPTLALVFVLLYLQNTWGRISFRNLWYPYFIAACALVLLTSIYATEILDVYRSRDQYTATVLDDTRETYEEWKLSIFVISLAVAYLYSIDYVGFFPSSFAMMAVMMKVGGVKKWRTIGIVCVGVTIFVYVMFIEVLGVRPPSGPLGVF